MPFLHLIFFIRVIVFPKYAEKQFIPEYLNVLILLKLKITSGSSQFRVTLVTLGLYDYEFLNLLLILIISFRKNLDFPINNGFLRISEKLNSETTKN